MANMNRRGFLSLGRCNRRRSRTDRVRGIRRVER